MDQPVSNEGMGNRLLRQVHEGMPVYDVEEKEVGKVRKIFFGGANDRDSEYGTGPAITAEPAATNSDPAIIYNVGKAIFGSDDDLPDVVRNRMMEYGFIQIDTGGLFSDFTYAMPDQIQSVDSNRVTLSTDKDNLVRGDDF